MTDDEIAFAERAAIMEYDGGLTRAEAEHRARMPVLVKRQPDLPGVEEEHQQAREELTKIFGRW